MNTIEVKFGTFSSFFDEVVKDKELVHCKIVRVEAVDVHSDIPALPPYQRPTAIVVTAVVGLYIYRSDITVCHKTDSSEAASSYRESIQQTLDYLRQSIRDCDFEARTGIFVGSAQMER